ncbi:MAG: hypothetical protein IPF71_15550, partial [Rhodoferax sp.]|nr:hypothetical protein [Rhodoferax sp.]
MPSRHIEGTGDRHRRRIACIAHLVAVIVQVPDATRVSVVPLTVQTPEVVEANETDRPEVEVADKAGGAAPIDWLPGLAKVMVCKAGRTAKNTQS